jgi:hypothetical protein
MQAYLLFLIAIHGPGLIEAENWSRTLGDLDSTGFHIGAIYLAKRSPVFSAYVVLVETFSRF